MLNKNNLYRVRLVLSAGNGTQVPKYLDAAGSINLYLTYAKWAKDKAIPEDLFNALPQDLQQMWYNRATGKKDNGDASAVGTLNLQPDTQASTLNPVKVEKPEYVQGLGTAMGIRNKEGRVVKMDKNQYMDYLKYDDPEYDQNDFEDDWNNYNSDNSHWNYTFSDGKGGFMDAFGQYLVENPDEAKLRSESEASRHEAAISTISPGGAGALETNKLTLSTSADPVEDPVIEPVVPVQVAPKTGVMPEMGMLPGDDPNGENSTMLKPITIGAATKTSGTSPQSALLQQQTPLPGQSGGTKIGGLPTSYGTPPAGGDPEGGGGINWQKAAGTAGQVGGAMNMASNLLGLAGLGEASKYAGLAGGVANAASTIMSGQGGAAGAMGAVGGLADTAKNMLFSGVHDNDSSLTSGLNSAYDSISNAAMAFAPVGTIIGGAMKVGGFIGDALSSMGVGTDQMTTTDQILDSNFLKLTPFGLINAIGAKAADKFAIDQSTRQDAESSYKGSYVKMDDAASKSGKKYGLFSRGALRRANEAIREAKRQQNIVRGINKDAKDMKSIATAMHDTNSLNYKYRLNGGYDQRSMRAAKRGIKIQYFTTETWEPLLEDVFEIKLIDINEVNSFKEGGNINGMINIDTHEIEWEPTLQEFKEGGKTPKEPEIEVIETDTNQKSVIPEGALHKNKHHMEDAEGLTKKGVPVVDNDGDQQAEIELNEIIFTLEVTKELEERYKEFYKEDTSNKRKDELALEAGKLLWHEILYNTEDRTGLINTLKKGGNIPTVTKEFKQGGSLTQDMVDDMVRLALINLLTR